MALTFNPFTGKLDFVGSGQHPLSALQEPQAHLEAQLAQLEHLVARVLQGLEQAVRQEQQG